NIRSTLPLPADRPVSYPQRLVVGSSNGGYPTPIVLRELSVLGRQRMNRSGSVVGGAVLFASGAVGMAALLWVKRKELALAAAKALPGQASQAAREQAAAVANAVPEQATAVTSAVPEQATGVANAVGEQASSLSNAVLVVCPGF